MKYFTLTIYALFFVFIANIGAQNTSDDYRKTSNKGFYTERDKYKQDRRSIYNKPLSGEMLVRIAR